MRIENNKNGEQPTALQASNAQTDISKPANAKPANTKPAATRPTAGGRSPEMIPLYDTNQFAMLIARERARADRAAVKPPETVQRRPAPAPVTAVKTGEQPKPSSAGVWGATTFNTEFSLVVFRPRARADRAGLVELLMSTVRTTDAVGIIDVRRLGVLLPDTAAENAVLFVKKILAAAEEIGVSLSHVVHTYPNDWPDDAIPEWNDSDRDHDHDQNGQAPGGHTRGGFGKGKHNAHPRSHKIEPQVGVGVIKVLVNWLQAVAVRRQLRRELRIGLHA